MDYTAYVDTELTDPGGSQPPLNFEILFKNEWNIKKIREKNVHFAPSLSFEKVEVSVSSHIENNVLNTRRFCWFASWNKEHAHCYM